MKRLVLLMALTILMVTLSAADLMPDFRLSDMDGNNVSLKVYKKALF